MSLAVRDATGADAPAIAAIYHPIVTGTAISFETEPPDQATMAARIDAARKTHAFLVAVADGVVGYAYGSAYRPRAAYATTAETTVYVAADARGKGVGAALYGALLPRLSARGFGQAVAGITLPNPPSIALHVAFGFHRAGVLTAVGKKFDVFHDVALYQRALS
ncbi:MAG: N-acetyltransferase family protein [Pseudomonadota bacterium]